MNAPVNDCIPTLATMFRLQWEPAQDCHVLLYPEGMVKLSSSAGEILKRVDGSSTVTMIIDDLKTSFPGADLETDVINFLQQARTNGWLTL